MVDGRMNDITFCIVHHATTPLHSFIFEKSISSVRKFHPANRIVVCCSSVTVVPEHILEYENTSFVYTPMDGSHVYGAMYVLLQLEGVKEYVLMHDSMILLKAFPESVLGRKFYTMWHFQSSYHDHTENVIGSICNTKFDYRGKCALLESYNEKAGVDWIGCFGPSFGGDIGALRELWEMMNVEDNLANFKGRVQLMAAERFVAVVASFMKLVEPFPGTYSLNDSIEHQPYKFRKSETEEDVMQVVESGYNAYMCKIWQGR